MKLETCFFDLCKELAGAAGDYLDLETSDVIECFANFWVISGEDNDLGHCVSCHLETK